MAFINDNVYRFFRVIDPDNDGQNVDADATPIAILRKNGVTVGAATVTVTKVDTGYYKVTTTLDESHGWSVGDTWSLEVSYEVSSASHKRCIGGGIIREEPSGSGTGAYAGTVTVDDGTDPIENAKVRVTLNGIVKAGTVETNANGEVDLALDTGTYTLSVTADGYQPSVTTFTVSGDDWSVTVSLTQINITEPSDPAQATGYVKCYDEEGNAEENVSVTVQIVTPPTSDGYAYDEKPWTETSDSNGMVYFTGLWQGAVYKIKRGFGSWQQFIVPSQSTFAIDEFIGLD